MSSTKVGIAIYAQRTPSGRPRSPHWALVLHPEAFSAEDVRVYHIRSRNCVWSLGHESCNLAGMGDLVGVLHVADVPPTIPGSDSAQKVEKPLGLEELDAFIKKFPATRSGDDPSALFVWTCESYVIRALAHLSAEGALELPCKPEEMYDFTKERIAVLKTSPSTATETLVIPYVE